ncbi:hypothetical protein HC928_00330 [bacterium]|nr:hypothetical protein [bacterium]
MTTNGWLDEETFSCFIPAQAVIVKGGEKGADKSGKRWIQGIASTDARDLQGEVIAQNGVDFSYFLKHGYFNDDHKNGPEHKVGQPTEAKLTKNGLWVKGFLFKNHKQADHYWELMQALEASGSDRKIGFSIQGKVLRKNGRTIDKCWIQDVAITTQPVNTTTWAEIVKSLSNQKWDLVKDKKEEDDAEKAMTSAGAPKVESLEGKQKDTTTLKSLTYAQAYEFVKSQTGLADEKAIKSIVNVAFDVFGKE